MGELVRQLVDKNREDIVKRLRNYLPPDQFFSLAYNLDRNPKLTHIAQRNPESLMNAIFEAADCGLLIGSAYDHCSLVTFGDEVQLMIEYRGLIYQLKRAGAVLKIDAACVYDGDFFEIRLGDDETYDHRPNINDERRRSKEWLYDKANIKGAYAVAWLPDPLRRLKQHRWCDMGEIEKARSISKNGENRNGPWYQHFPAMAMKTAVRRVVKLIEVCGPTDENKQAWERYGKTIELDNRDYSSRAEEPKVDDMPGKSGKSGPKSGRAVETPASTQGATPSPRNGERRTKASAAASPPPLKAVEKPAAAPTPPTDELIGLAAQQDLMEKANNAGLDPDSFYDHIHEKYGVPGLKHLKQSQAAEVEQYLRTIEAER